MNNIANYLIQQLALQKDRLFLWSPVALALGIALYFSLKTEAPLAVGIIAFATGLALVFLAYPHHQDNARRFSLWLLALTLALSASGFFAAQIHTRLVYTPMLGHEIKFAKIEGMVESIEKLENETGSRLILKNLVIEKLQPAETPRTVRLKLRKDEGIAPGQRIRVLAGLNPASPPVMPGAFDFQRYSYFAGIGAVGFIYKPPEILSQPARSSWDLFWEQARLRIIGQIERYMGPREAPMAAALIVGKERAIAQSDVIAMRNSGLTHIISISGLHIGLVSAILFFISRFLMTLVPSFALRHPIKKYAAVIAILGAFFYTVLAGAPVPTQRSMLMTSTIFFAIILDRAPLSMRVVTFAALIVLLLAPDSLLSASFQMSFAAVGALIAFYEHFSPKLSEFYRDAGFLKRCALYFFGVCVTTLIAGTATEPFTLYHFQQFTSYGLLANAIAVPLSSFVIMPAALFGVILMPLHLSAVPFYVMAKGIDWMYVVAYWVAGLPGSVLLTPAWPLAALILVVVSALIVMLWKGHLKAIALIPALVCVLIVFQFKQPDILVSSDSTLKAIRAEDGTLYASTRSKERFTLENWERMYGLNKGEAQKWPSEGQAGGLACDAQGCRITLKDKKIAFVSDLYALAQDCAWADLVISDDFTDHHCAAPYVLDRGDSWREGAQSVFIEGNSIRVRRTDLERGNRPWVAKDKKD